MTDDEYRRRILAVEEYASSRDWYHPRIDQRLLERDAVALMTFLSECVEADFYGQDRPRPANCSLFLAAEMEKALTLCDAHDWRINDA